MAVDVDERKDALLDALDYLGKEDVVKVLNVRRENANAGDYFVAFIGQFSAGKSYLINNLLQRDLLRSGSSETTPLLTYIRYGEQECGILHFDDGSDQQISIEDVKNITQQNCELDFSKLEYMEVFVDADFLRAGMVLLDTPGVNTVIDRHEQLLSRSMELAAKIIYVSGNQPSRMDIGKLTALRDTGFSPCFVRTHCDQIKESEEKDIAKAIQQDLDILSEIGIPAEDCFHISNEADSSWHDNIAPLRKMMQDLGNNAQEELQVALNSWEQSVAEECLTLLKQKEENLIAKKAGDESELQEKLNAIQEKIAGFERMAAQRKARLDKEIEACQNELMNNARQELQLNVDKASQRIEKSWEIVKTGEEMSQLIDREVARFAFAVNEKIDTTVAPILHGVQNGSDEDDSFVVTDLPQFDRYSELEQEENDRIQQLNAKLETIRQNRSLLEEVLEARSTSPEFVELQRDLAELENEIAEAQSAVDGLPAYQPKYVEVDDGKRQPSEVASSVGQTLDWVFLLLPGAQISNGLKAAAKSAKLVEKGARVLAKAEKIIKAADAGKDVAYTARGIKAVLENKRKAYATKKRKAAVQNGLEQAAHYAASVEAGVKDKNAPPSFLDYLTIQHWATEFGKHFDRPPRMEIDREYEASYRAQKEAITSRLIAAQRKNYEKNCELRRYGSETERIEAERKAAIADEKEVDLQLSRERSKIQHEAENRARKKWAATCAEWFKKQIEAQMDSALSKSAESLPSKLAAYQEHILSHAFEQLQYEKGEYQRLCALPKSEAEQELAIVSGLIADLKGAFPEDNA
jgi:hypothetical protein